MKPLLLHTSLPCAIVDTAALGDAAAAGESLPADGSASIEEKMCFVLQLLEHERTGDAAMLLDTINYNPNALTPSLYTAWLWLAMRSFC